MGLWCCARKHFHRLAFCSLLTGMHCQRISADCRLLLVKFLSCICEWGSRVLIAL